MRCIAAALLLLVPLTASAQSTRSRTAEPPAATLPPIGLPLPAIGLPLAPLGVGPETDTRSPRPPSQRPPRRGSGRGRSGGIVYVLPAVPPATAAPSAAPAIAPSAPAAPASGTLVLDVTPAAVGEVFVDGYLVGRADEVNGAMALPPGPHRVEVRADGYAPLAVDVRIDHGGTVTLRRTLESTAAAADPTPASDAKATQAPAPPIARKPFYFIPGCYLGDVPPKDAGLPASCDLSKTVVVRP